MKYDMTARVCDMVGAELIRTKTLAAGDECCNFHVIRKKG